ncbi:nonsense-mediated mRNA decay factor SMG5 isoform X1 [Nerophis lumbriciformis]|uniref:nonsense-mediated mRNA decay factor SMG5 isoform X1 n=2 Tax=Nerophis lumbriciformis TaxID=546530 RepID=UPI002ADF1074|nr:nonsense-mediated mRNA decay factor SMG5 isoform X1 [Nerophis lumbriciformis]
MSGPGQDNEPEAKVLLIKRLYRAVVESVHKLDVIIGSKASYREVFKPENISLRNKLRELCVKLMFLHPVDYGRKAEELLWRKVYYEVIQVIKTNKKHIHSRSVLECAYRTHLIAGVGFYQHLLLYIQSHYQLELQNCIDWTHVTDPLIGRKKAVSASPKEMEWAQMACHRCLVYLGDLARYQNELAGVEAEHLAERFYHQALSVMPHVGMPFNQLGTLAGSKFYNVEATYYYLRCIQSETPFEGAYGNLKRLFDKAAKMYHQVKKQEMKKLSPSRQRSRDIKRLLVSFMYLQSLLQPKNSLMEAELTSLCQSVLEDFNLVLFYLPTVPAHTSHPLSEEEEEQHAEGPCAVLPDTLVFKMVVTCLMVVHSLKRGGSKQYSASIAFTLALFSHLVNHVNIRLQAELEEGESQVPPLNTADDLETREALPADGSEERPLQNGTLEREEEEEQNEIGAKKNSGVEDEEKQKQKKKYTRLSRLRRRRCGRKDHRGEEDESDLSEGFESEDDDEEEEEAATTRDCAASAGRTPPGASPDPSTPRKEVKKNPLGEEGCWGSGSEEEEEGGTAFDVETDSDMNSQESRSDLEDIDDSENCDNHEVQAPEHQDEEENEEQPKEEGGDRSVNTPPTANGPPAANEASISSNLQAMSSQLFQAKRCFRLAPTFSNKLLRPQAASGAPAPANHSTPPPQETPPTAMDSTCDDNQSAPNGTNENDVDSDAEGSQHSVQSVHSEKTLLEKLEILTNQGLIQVVKVFIDWLRTNTDIILMCAQSSQSLWNRLSVLLNLLPDGNRMLEAEVDLDPDVTELLNECERPALVQTLLLPEDVALRHLPALGVSHRHLDFARHSTSLSPLQECIVRVCCIRSFGHFLTSLQGNVLHFNPEAGIFTSVSQSQPDNLVQQAKAQFRMAEEEARRNRLMRDMAQLRLQLEVSQLEGSLQQPKAQSSISPYLVPDTAAMCQNLSIIRHLAGSGCFIIIIPRTVIDGLDRLKKENAGARDSIRFLESEFRKGNRYIRCQKESGRSFERDKLKRQDIDAWHMYKMVDSCRQLTVSQSNGDDDTAGMVMLLTGHQVDELCSRSAAMKSAVQAAGSAGMELKNIVEFYRQWKEIG